MKKFAMLCTITLFVASCGSKTDSNKEEYGAPDETSQAETTKVDVIAEGESLVKASDCKTCHHATNKLIGPAHTDVAKKYEFTQANVTYLADKIIKGGTGVWGQIPMTAHTDVSQANAEKMARYVLSLDGEKEH
jgi:cytochrome c